MREIDGVIDAGADAEAVIERDPKRWIALVVLVLPVMLIAVDNTVLGFAVPSLTADLQPSSGQLLWIMDVYSFVVAGLLVIMGTIGDRIGRRKLLLIGGVAFSAASLLAAFATSPAMLIGARALLGAAGATLMPSTLSLIRNLFADPRERGLALAVWAMSFGVGGTLGPILGGVMLEHFWWGSVFLLALPVTALLLLAGPFLLPESRDPAPGPFDLPSAALSLGTMLPFVYGIKLMAEHGITFQAGIAVVVGISLGVVFLRRQRRLTHPMIDLSLFSYRGFRAGIGANFVACIAWASALFFLTQYLQLVLGMSAVRAGMHLLPGLALSLAGTMLARRLLARWRVATLIRLALGIAGVGFALLAFVARDGGALTASVAYVLIGSGLNITIALGVDAVMEHVPPRQAGAGSAVSETANELGIALGTAVLGSIVTAVYRRRLDHVAGVPDAVIDEGRETLGGAVHAAAGLPEPARTALIDTARQAFVDGTRIATLVCAVLVVAAGWGVRRALRP
jgi:DHA2 family multidrug resistance protein-like MFS transporter